MFAKYLSKIGDVREVLIRNGYEIYINASKQVYFFYDSKFDRDQGIWDSDGELILAFLNGRAVTAYYAMSAVEVEAPYPPVVPFPVVEPVIEPVVAEPVVAEPVAKPVIKPVFKPDLTLVAEPPAQSTDFLEVLSGGDDYVVYAKQDNTFHIHWKVSREQAKEVWRRDRSHIEKWLGVDVLTTVSWDVEANKTPKWKEISAPSTATVLRQVTAFGKPIAEIAQLDDGTYHVYFRVPKEHAKQIYANIKAEFEGYEVDSVSFE